MESTILHYGEASTVSSVTNSSFFHFRLQDGDTLYIGQEKVRLYAVDAPEKSQVNTAAKTNNSM